MITNTLKELTEMGIWRSPYEIPYGQMEELEMSNTVLWLSLQTPPKGGHKALQHYRDLAAAWVPLLELYIQRNQGASKHILMRLNFLLQSARNGIC